MKSTLEMYLLNGVIYYLRDLKHNLEKYKTIKHFNITMVDQTELFM